MRQDAPGKPGLRRRRAGMRGPLAAPLVAADPTPAAQLADVLAELRHTNTLLRELVIVRRKVAL